MTSKIKVDNITDQGGNELIKRCGSTTTVGSGSGNTINICGSTITLGRSGGTVSLASGASQTGLGRTGTVNWDTTAKTASFTAVSGNGYFVNTTSGAITVTLPASPSAGDIVAVADYAGTSATNAITIGRNSSNIEGEASDSTISTNKASRTLVYVDGTQGWKLVNDATQALVTTYDAHYFVLAGGGGGGYASNTWGTGGGGGGGFRNSYDSPLAAPGCGVNIVAGNSYPITVGAGGATGPSSSPYVGNPGSTSTFSTITSTGGGGGAANVPGTTGGPGGSGGGGSYGSGDNALPGGTGNTPPVSPPQGNNGADGQSSYGRGAGGGGAGGAGSGSAPGGNNDGGTGGPGLATSISGSPTTKASGGKGGSYVNSPAGTPSEPANSGNGGGGTGCSRAAADGGSGIVIIRYTTADAPSSASGGTKTTSGSDTIHTFTGPGTFTA
jgi:hypothetical protein